MHDRKYKIEDNKLVKRSNGLPIPADEPLFILRAQDINALPILVAYHIICKNLSHQANVVKSIIDFDDFRKDHLESMKEPDTE